MKECYVRMVKESHHWKGSIELFGFDEHQRRVYPSPPKMVYEVHGKPATRILDSIRSFLAANKEYNATHIVRNGSENLLGFFSVPLSKGIEE